MECLVILAKELLDVVHGGLFLLVLLNILIELGCFLSLQEICIALVVYLLRNLYLLLPKSCKSDLLPQAATCLPQGIEELALYCPHLLDNLILSWDVLVHTFSDSFQIDL